MKTLIQKILQNTFVSGLVMALSIVAADTFSYLALGNPFDVHALYLAAGVAVVGYVGKFLTGSANTTLAMLGSALIAIIPMMQGEKINWFLVGCAFLAKFFGLATDGKRAAHVVRPGSDPNAANSPTQPNQQ